jgi:hypothetical protein
MWNSSRGQNASAKLHKSNERETQSAADSSLTQSALAPHDAFLDEFFPAPCSFNKTWGGAQLMELERRVKHKHRLSVSAKNSLFSDKIYFTHGMTYNKKHLNLCLGLWAGRRALLYMRCASAAKNVCVRARRSRLVIISCMCFIIPFQKLHSIER